MPETKQRRTHTGTHRWIGMGYAGRQNLTNRKMLVSMEKKTLVGKVAQAHHIKIEEIFSAALTGTSLDPDWTFADFMDSGGKIIPPSVERFCRARNPILCSNPQCGKPARPVRARKVVGGTTKFFCSAICFAKLYGTQGIPPEALQAT